MIERLKALLPVGSVAGITKGFTKMAAKLEKVVARMDKEIDDHAAEIEKHLAKQDLKLAEKASAQRVLKNITRLIGG